MTILIVDNQIKTLDSIRLGLEQNGHFIHIAEDGNEGVLRALTKRYDLILLSWLLPGLSGLEVCRAIRQKDMRTPILFTTQKETLDQTIKGLEYGANDYIKKPFSLAELLTRVSTYNSTRDFQSRYSIGDIVVDLNTYQVLKGTKEIKLTQKEFLLFSYLLRHKGKVCLRNDIIREVWGTNYDYDPGIIDVYVNAIRKKLKITKEDRTLKTIRGVGFIMAD